MATYFDNVTEPQVHMEDGLVYYGKDAIDLLFHKAIITDSFKALTLFLSKETDTLPAQFFPIKKVTIYSDEFKVQERDL